MPPRSTLFRSDGPVGPALSRCLDAALILAIAAGSLQAAPRTKTIQCPAAYSRSGQPGPGPGDYEHTLKIQGRDRRYELHVPPGYDGKNPMPLVLNLHGGGGTSATARRHTHMDEKADEAGFIVVYPDGTGRLSRRLLTWNAGRCCGYAVLNQIDDVGFIDFVLADVAKHFRVDQKRIYAAGHSNGGMMCYRLACERSRRFAAIASVAGPLFLPDCKPERPIPVIHIHGTDDRIVPPKGGIGSRSLLKLAFPPLKETVDAWLARNGCPSTPSSSTTSGNVTIDRHLPARGDAEVVLVTINGGGHLWPGGQSGLPAFMTGKNPPSGANANDLIWEFFARHRLP